MEKNKRKDNEKMNQVNNKGQVVKAPFSFGKALNHLKRGDRVKRQCWDKGIVLVYQKGYPSGINCNKQTAEAWGIEEGDLFKCQPYLQKSVSDGAGGFTHIMYTPDNMDLFANDWILADARELTCDDLR